MRFEFARNVLSILELANICQSSLQFLATKKLGALNTWFSLHWNRTNGGVINGGVSPTIAERNKIDQICAKFAGFARKFTKFVGKKRGVNPLCLPNLREIYQICYGPLCYDTLRSCLTTPRGPWRAPAAPPPWNSPARSP